MTNAAQRLAEGIQHTGGVRLWLHYRSVSTAMSFRCFGHSKEAIAISRTLLVPPRHVLLCGPQRLSDEPAARLTVQGR
ncbi:hypothetical protein M446_6876 [Methylobacterium sp. 4-46]|nr:hypothetical protein M446_6876 [Methylobacterium sp. 4-46]